MYPGNDWDIWHKHLTSTVRCQQTPRPARTKKGRVGKKTTSSSVFHDEHQQFLPNKYIFFTGFRFHPKETFESQDIFGAFFPVLHPQSSTCSWIQAKTKVVPIRESFFLHLCISSHGLRCLFKGPICFFVGKKSHGAHKVIGHAGAPGFFGSWISPSKGNRFVFLNFFSSNLMVFTHQANEGKTKDGVNKLRSEQQTRTWLATKKRWNLKFIKLGISFPFF